MDIPILRDITIIFSVAALSLFICHKWRIPEILGYLITGILLGPYGLSVIHAVHEVEIMAEIGVVLLLFAVGLEFSLQHLVTLKRPALLGGFLQVGLTAGLLFGLSFVLFRYELPFSILLGMMASISSTAIILKVLGAKQQLDSPHGRVSTAILIFQDIAVIPMILALPLIAGHSAATGDSIGIMLLKAVGLIAVVFIGARIIAPRIFHMTAATKNQELFLLVVVLLCLGTALLSYKAGLSLALGAFLAGIMVTESGYGQQALGNVIPFKDVFTGFFFVSVGMLVQPMVFAAHPALIISSAAGILLSKTLIAGVVVLFLGYPLKTAIFTGIALAQVGEFSFIMASTANSLDIFPQGQYPIAVTVIVLTMAASPFYINAAPRLVEIFLNFPFSKKLKAGTIQQEAPRPNQLTDHMIVIGYGIIGKQVGKAAKKSGIGFSIIEMNPDTVREEKIAGECIYFGDASQDVVLEKAGIENARIIVVTIPDPAAVRRIVETARRMQPSIYIIARARYFLEMEPLHQLGANDVVVEEFETSIETFARALQKYQIGLDQIHDFTMEIRSDGYRLFRDNEAAGSCPSEMEISGMQTQTITVPVNSSAHEKTLREMDIRFRYAINVLAIHRGNEKILNPGSDTVIHERDDLIIIGASQAITKLNEALRK